MQSSPMINLQIGSEWSPVQLVRPVSHGRHDELIKELKVDTNNSYADDTTIMSTVFEKLQLSTEQLQAACSKWGITIYFKCKVITSSDKRIVLEGEELETVGEFCFLSIVPSTGRDVSRRLALTSTTQR